MKNEFVFAGSDLEAAYAEMAQDKTREADALEWTEMVIRHIACEIWEIPLASDDQSSG